MNPGFIFFRNSAGSIK